MAVPALEPGKVYRTRDLARWDAHPTRLVTRLVETGELGRLGRGLFASPVHSRFGLVPPSDEALLEALLEGDRWLVTGPPRWNALGLGATAVFPIPLVYNSRRSGLSTFGGRRFRLSRTRFPEAPTAAWFAVDLLSRAGQAGLSRERLVDALGVAVRAGRFDRDELREAADEYATQEIQGQVRKAIALDLCG